MSLFRYSGGELASFLRPTPRLRPCLLRSFGGEYPFRGHGTPRRFFLPRPEPGGEYACFLRPTPRPQLACFSSQPACFSSQPACFRSVGLDGLLEPRRPDPGRLRTRAPAGHGPPRRPENTTAPFRRRPPRRSATPEGSSSNSTIQVQAAGIGRVKRLSGITGCLLI